VRKHAHTNTAHIICTVQDEQIQIIIADDGCGFTLPDTPDAGHFGLTIMQERAEALGGTITWRTEPGQGTHIVITLPRHYSPLSAKGNELNQIRVVIVDDHPMFRDGLHNLLTAHGVQVVGLGSDGLQAQALANLQPDIMLLDMHMPLCDGLQATQRIKTQYPHLKIILLTVEAKEDILFAALQAGAVGYLLKNVPGADLLERLIQVMHGETVISSGLATQALHEFAHRATQPANLNTLSPQQIAILSLLADGLTYKEIALRLALAESTIRYHVGQIIDLLQVNNRREAIALARQYGLSGSTST
jgi:DNA-binding NarL/FixJ family response regulator